MVTHKFSPSLKRVKSYQYANWYWLPIGKPAFIAWAAQSDPLKLIDFDTARFHRFRNHAFQVDIQQAVNQVSTTDVDVFR